MDILRKMLHNGLVWIFVLVLLIVSKNDVQSTGYTYHDSYESLTADLRRLSNQHPSIARLEPLSPETSEGRTLWAIKISDNVQSTENENRILYVGTHHAREWISTEVAFLLAEYLVSNYGTDPTVTSIIDNEEIWILPVMNPDGYDYTQIDRLWRKNRRDNGPFCNLISQSPGWGVDLNRNYGSQSWGTIDDQFSSRSCLAYTYIGPSAFSEAETQAVRNLMNSYSFQAVLSYHSFSQLILYPWGHTKDPIPQADHQLLASMALQMSQEISKVPGSLKYTPKQSAELYQTAGDLTDWTYETFRIPSFTIELRPCENCQNIGFELPASQIEPTWNENKPAALFLANFFNLQISSPSQTKPVFAGSADKPAKVKIIVNGLWRGRNKEDFSVKIGGASAQVITATRLPEVMEQPQNAYEILIQPPAKNTEGRYDLEVKVGGASAQVKKGVAYGESTSVNVILVIDRSGSMSGQPISNAKNAAKQFVDLVSNEDKLGVVSFSSGAAVAYPLTAMEAAEKQNAKNAIDSLFASGSTAIGSGLQLASNQLTERGDPNSRWAIVLLSDGEENVAPYVASVLPGIKSAGITVYTVGLGSVDEALMKDIADQTDGTYSFAPSSQDLVNIYNLVAAQVTAQQTIQSTTQSIQQDEVVNIPASVDSSVSEATFSITWGGSDLDLQLISPTGKVISPATLALNPAVIYSTGPTYELYRVKTPEKGEWTLVTTGIDVDSSGTEPFTARIVGKAKLTMDTLVGSGFYTDDTMIIRTTLTDSKPITGASITASVLPPLSSTPISIMLIDDGAHLDGLSNDGVYAGSFTDTNVAGSYEITVTASGVSNSGSQFRRENSIAQLLEQRPIVTVNIVAPSGRQVTAGESFTEIFTIENNGSKSETYDIIAGPLEEDQWANLTNVPKSITVNAHASKQISIPVLVPPEEHNPNANVLTLIATSQTEPLNSASASTTAKIPASDLFISASGSTKVQPGAVESYTISFGNKTITPARNIVMALDLPDGVQYIDSSLGDPVTLSNGLLGWFLSSMNGNEEESFTIQLRISQGVHDRSTLSIQAGILSGFVPEGAAPATPDVDAVNNLMELPLRVTNLAIQIVDIDIRPRSEINYAVCNNKRSLIPVAILNTSTFNVLTVDDSSVTFEGAKPRPFTGRTNRPLSILEDVDLDGDLDKIFQFLVGNTTLGCESNTATLKGRLKDGTSFGGKGSIKMIKTRK